jgi:hypothetical protein
MHDNIVTSTVIIMPQRFQKRGEGIDPKTQT